MRQKLLLTLFLAAWCFSASAATQLKIVTARGVVSFVADDEWPVLSMQTKLPIATVVFQLPNAADEGTPDSTNLALRLFDDSPVARKAFDAPVGQLGDAPVITQDWEGWSVSRRTARQGDSVYTIIDAKNARVADVAASIRLAWPHLPGNTASHDADMEARFREFLRSVQGEIGPYAPENGEVVRRPIR